MKDFPDVLMNKLITSASDAATHRFLSQLDDSDGELKMLRDKAVKSLELLDCVDFENVLVAFSTADITNRQRVILGVILANFNLKLFVEQ